MKEARLRALTLIFLFIFLSSFDCRNERSPVKGIDTLLVAVLTISLIGRNERSPVKGINTQQDLYKAKGNQRRNERSPVKGIDTLDTRYQSSPERLVEMKEARFRALTQFIANFLELSIFRRNERSPL